MNTTVHNRTPQLARLIVPVAAMMFAPALAACSGPGADMSMRRSDAIGFLCFIGACLVAVPVLLMRLKRRGLTLRALAPVLGLVFHPAWWIGSSGGDCGDFRREVSLVFSGLWVLVLLLEAVHLGAVHKPDRYSLGKAGPAIVVVLLCAALTVWFLPWTLHPLPTQARFARYTSLPRVEHAQYEFKTNHGYYASSADELFDGKAGSHLLQFDGWLSNGDALSGEHDNNMHYARMLQGTSENPQAWQVEGGLSNWAVIARPVGFPTEGEWVQYLFLSDGSVLSKPDTGTGQYLLEGVPDDLEADGWSPISEEDSFWLR